jgi:hypothetical protein
MTATRKRNWRGHFVKNLRPTADGSREWLIWSRYHNAWHCRSSIGGACGYTDDIARAGVFERSKADGYNDGDRNEAFHVSEKLPLLHAAIRQHNEALENLLFAAAIAAGTQRAETSETSAPSEVDRWRPITGYEGFYSVSRDGRVFSHITNREMAPVANSSGYATVQLRSRRYRIHRLVCAAFNGPANALHRHVSHLNGDKSDNRADNLKWVSPADPNTPPNHPRST